MVRIYAPAAVAILAIIGLTAAQAITSNRFTGGSVTAEEIGQRFAKVPLAVGPWVGKDTEVDKATLEQAGAVQHVSRRYVNSETKQSVDLWLVVGHSRDICRHTPDICYPSQGFSQLGERVKWPFEDDDDNSNEPPTFFTAKFRNETNAGSRERRVFWAWNGNTEGQDRWDAPELKTWFDWLGKSTGPKTFYGNNTALYKMYFTADMADLDEDVADNVANDFAEVMLPQIDRALFPERFVGEAPLAAPVATAAEAAGKMPEGPMTTPATGEPAAGEPAASEPAPAG
jgi:hypothetical protein